MFGTMKQWTLRGVMSVLCKTDIIEGVKRRFMVDPGTPLFLGLFQTVLSEMMDNLSEEERQKYERQAEEWNQDGVPIEMRNQ